MHVKHKTPNLIYLKGSKSIAYIEEEEDMQKYQDIWPTRWRWYWSEGWYRSEGWNSCGEYGEARWWQGLGAYYVEDVFKVC